MADFKSELRKDEYKVLFAVTMLTENTNKKQNQNRKPTKSNHTTKNTTNKTKKTG